MQARWLARRRWTLWTAIVLAVVGSMALGVNWRHNHEYVWWPVNTPLSIEAGQSVDASFVSQLDEPHEIEIAFSRHITESDRREISALGVSRHLDIRWTVSSEGQVIAKGACRDYLYFERASASFPRRVIWQFLNRASRQRWWRIRGGLARGVGQIQCRAGVRYDVQAQVDTTVDSLNQAHPKLGVRVNRVFMNRHYRQTRLLSLVGFVSVGTSVVLFCTWGWMRRNRAV